MKRLETINYFAKGNEVWVRQPHLPEGELFITVHLTSSASTPEKQATVIAQILNAEEA